MGLYTISKVIGHSLKGKAQVLEISVYADSEEEAEDLASDKFQAMRIETRETVEKCCNDLSRLIEVMK